ncbi:unnamed protein product, partial [Polarella glacialis]
MADAQRDFNHQGLWSYLPWIFLEEEQRAKSRKRIAGHAGQRWAVFLEPSTAVDPAALEAVLAGYDAKDPWYLGRSLKDENMVIIHHYQQEPAYPLAPAGFAISASLLQLLVQNLKEHPLSSGQQIEPVWELADRLAKKLQVKITDRRDAFCSERAGGCATWVNNIDIHRSSHSLRPESVVIAVKTVSTFHDSRVKLVQDFWAGTSPVKVLFLSNEAFGAVPGAQVVDLSPEFGDMVDPKKEST